MRSDGAHPELMQSNKLDQPMFTGLRCLKDYLQIEKEVLPIWFPQYSPIVICRKGETVYLADTLSSDSDQYQSMNQYWTKPKTDYAWHGEVTKSYKLFDSRYVQSGWSNEKQSPGQAIQYWHFRNEINEAVTSLWSPRDQRTLAIARNSVILAEYF